LKDEGYRVEADLRTERTGFKIREAQLHKVPYMLIVGDKEAESGEVSVRSRDRGDLGSMTVESLLETLEVEREQ
jgi:threonyl-tRNA synthetase